MKRKIRCSKVYYKYKKALEDGHELILNYGGARSSKSYSTAQLKIHRFLTLKKYSQLWLRKTLPSLKRSILRDFYTIMSYYGLKSGLHYHINKTDMLATCLYNGNTIDFVGLDNPEKAKSSQWNEIWMEEATDFSFDDYLQMDLRTSAPVHNKGIKNTLTLTYNPIDEFHWIKEKIFDNNSIKKAIIHSTYKDNPALQSLYKQRIENLINQDINYYRVYAKGLWGRLENLIYSNWSEFKNHIPEGDDVIYGLDFGYVNESVLDKITLKRQKKGLPTKAFVEELIYESGLTNEMLIKRMDEVLPNKKVMIYADHNKPDFIDKIKEAGYCNVFLAKKEVLTGIDTVKKYQLHIHQSATNTLKEIKSYSWKTDKNKRVLEEPVKFMDHAMDAIRYALHSHESKYSDITCFSF